MGGDAGLRGCWGSCLTPPPQFCVCVPAENRLLPTELRREALALQKELEFDTPGVGGEWRPPPKFFGGHTSKWREAFPPPEIWDQICLVSPQNKGGVDLISPKSVVKFAPVLSKMGGGGYP